MAKNSSIGACIDFIMDSISETSSDESHKSESGTKEYKCTYENCTAEFSKNSKLQYHLRRHTGERPFVCDEPNCGKTYLYSFHLRRHKLKHTNKSRKYIPCTVEGCHLELSNESNLKRHIKRKHNTEREYPYCCKDCKQGFYRKRQLLQHSYIHTGVYPFKCEICGLTFLTVRDCNRHKRTHKRYPCKCDQSFERWTQLLKHKKTCNLMQPKCNICNKTFARRMNLKQHLQLHLQNKINTYSCTYDNCNRSYLYKKNLIYHINKYHEKVTTAKFKCNHCDNSFSQRQNIISHIARFHSTTGNSVKKVSPRKPRKDKGTIQQNVAAALVGLKLPLKAPKKRSATSNCKESVLKKKASNVEKNCTIIDAAC